MALRRALIDRGVGLWLAEPAAKSYAAGLKARGKHGGIIACALAHRATRIAYALVRVPRQLRPVPLELMHPPAGGGLSSVPVIGAGTQELPTCSARSAARTNDVDGDEHRRTLTYRGKRQSSLTRHCQERGQNQPHLHNSGRRCQAGWERRAGADAVWAMTDLDRGNAASSLAPGPSPFTAARTTPDDPQRSHKSVWAPRHPKS